MTSAISSDPRSSLRTKAKPNSDARIYCELEGFHAIGDTKTMPSDSTRRIRRSSTGKHRERSSSRLDTSVRSESSLKAKSKTESRRRRSPSAIATSTTGSYEMTTDKSATETLSSPAESSGKTMRRRGSSERRMSISASEIIADTTGSSEKTKSSSGTSEQTMRKRGSSERRMSISASEIITDTTGSSEKTKSSSGTSEQTMRKRGSSEKMRSMSVSEIITNTAEPSEKTKSSSGPSEKKMRRRSSDFITSTAGSHGKELGSSASRIIHSTAGSSQKKKSSSGSSEKKFSKVSSELITSTVVLSEEKMSKSASDVVASRAESSRKKMSRAASESTTNTNASSEKKATRAASEIMTCTDGAFDTAMKRSTSEVMTSAAGSSERTKSSSEASEKKKSKSASEKVKSRAESSEKKRKKKSKSIDPLGTSLRSTKTSITVAKSDGFDSTHKERTGRKPSKELGEQPQETATLTVKQKTDEIPIMNANDVGAWLFENASWFNDDLVTEPSLNYLEARRQQKQVNGVSKVSTQQQRKARSKSIPQVSIDLLIPKLTDTPMSGISMDDLDWEEAYYKKSCLDLGACAPSDDAQEQPLVTVRGEEMESLDATRGVSKPRKITAKTDVKIRQDLDALRELDRKLTSLLSLETRRRLREADKPRPTLDELIIPQGSVTPMSGLSMDGTELFEGHAKESKESILNLGSSATSFDADNNSFATDLDEDHEVHYADDEKRSQRKPSMRHSLCFDDGISVSDENETLQRRRTLRRSDSCKERVGSKPETTTITDAKDCESNEIPIRDNASNKVRSRKTATARREGRNPSSQCLDETRHSRQLENDKQSKSRHKEKRSKSDQYYYDLHIPRRFDPPLSGISMSDLEWVEDLYSTIDTHPGLM
ncbi:hypothetical protein MHU86_7194 [Fragilaria crotonensis]|nr:hypothetical protein MHU86_7194 [Fragilaria crotonensis]